MPLGDSITWGVGSSTGNGYRGPLWDRLAADGHPLDFVGTLRGGSMPDRDNEGHSGFRIDQIASLADASLTRYRPNVVTLEIGTNDLNGNYQPSTASARLKSLRVFRVAPGRVTAGS
nr:GDSL-type esterase/lipase family protein [Streptomyces lacrimifluminis]